MMILPFVLGAIAAGRSEALGWGHLFLFLFWMLGYFTFNSASGWLKAASRQKPKFLRPLVSYAVASTIFGVITLIAVGLRPLPWLLAFLPLIIPSLWLAARRKERATIGGLLTVAAASLMLPVARYLYPSSYADWPQVLSTTMLVFGYFFGTVLFVKTNIRERGVKAYLVASAIWHALLLIAGLSLAAAGMVTWWWALLLAAVMVRTVVVPPMKLKPLPLGLIEVAISSTIVLISFFA